jgi:hypothetical protein
MVTRAVRQARRNGKKKNRHGAKLDPSHRKLVDLVETRNGDRSKTPDA